MLYCPLSGKVSLVDVGIASCEPFHQPCISIKNTVTHTAADLWAYCLTLVLGFVCFLKWQEPIHIGLAWFDWMFNLLMFLIWISGSSGKWRCPCHIQPNVLQSRDHAKGSLRKRRSSAAATTVTFTLLCPCCGDSKSKSDKIPPIIDRVMFWGEVFFIPTDCLCMPLIARGKPLDPLTWDVSVLLL